MIHWGIYTSIFLTGDLQVALKGSGVRFGIYHAMIEWFNPIWLADQRNNLTTQHYVKVSTPVHVLKADEHDLISTVTQVYKSFDSSDFITRYCTLETCGLCVVFLSWCAFLVLLHFLFVKSLVPCKIQWCLVFSWLRKSALKFDNFMTEYYNNVIRTGTSTQVRPLQQTTLNC